MSFDVDLVVRRGEARVSAAFATGGGATVLFGPSGVGKTSVLAMVAGLLRADAGHVRVGGRTLFDAAARVDVRPEHRRAGYVFQEPRLFPHLKVRANLLYARRSRDLARLAFLGIDHLFDRWPATLSGGEAQRVSIGRALMRDPAFLLLDEPMASVDPARREEILRAIEHVRDTLRLPILMVTHDPDEADRIGTDVVRM